MSSAYALAKIFTSCFKIQISINLDEKTHNKSLKLPPICWRFLAVA